MAASTIPRRVVGINQQAMPTEVGAGHKSGEVGDRAATQGDDGAVSIKPRSVEVAPQGMGMLQTLDGLTHVLRGTEICVRRQQRGN